MGVGTMIGVVMVTFFIFTMIIGAGLLFYQSTVAIDVGMHEPEPIVKTVQQSNAIVILLLFILAALLFLAGSTQWVMRASR